NAALEANPPGGDRHITTHASDWLWAVFAIMLISWLIVLGWTFASRRHNRIFHFIPLIVLSVASVAYFAMASDLGWTLVTAEFRGHPTRQIWYVRYIQWFINAPLLLLSLLSFTHIATAQILTILFFSWFLVVNGLIGALVSSSYKWGFFVFGLFGLFFIWCVPICLPIMSPWLTVPRIELLGHVPGQRGSFQIGEFKWGYVAGSAYISFIWMLYPICWGLSEGGNKISPTSEMVFYGILDIMSAPVFLLGFI
ncbi:heat shock protein 30, partial [Imleria badia]